MGTCASCNNEQDLESQQVVIPPLEKKVKEFNQRSTVFQTQSDRIIDQRSPKKKNKFDIDQSDLNDSQVNNEKHEAVSVHESISERLKSYNFQEEFEIPIIRRRAQSTQPKLIKPQFKSKLVSASKIIINIPKRKESTTSLRYKLIGNKIIEMEECFSLKSILKKSHSRSSRSSESKSVHFAQSIEGHQRNFSSNKSIQLNSHCRQKVKKNNKQKIKHKKHKD